MYKQILLNKKHSKTSQNVKNGIAVELVGNKQLLTDDRLSSLINLQELYRAERADCGSCRLTVTINPICTNVLFNYFTEVVKEDENGFTVANYNNINTDALIYKSTEDFNGKDTEQNELTTPTLSDNAYRIYQCIDDTQLSNNDCGYDYYCGLDFFNNHLLRSQTFKSVNKLTSQGQKSIYKSVFNTLCDYHRNSNGEEVHDNVQVGSRNLSKTQLHLYQREDILEFDETVEQRLIERNGWFGFINRSKLSLKDDKGKTMNINKPINSRKACDFIDMYPSRDLFFFSPKYNPYRKRIEKNWEYFLTYPYSSTTENIPYFADTVDGTALRLFLIDDTLNDSFRCFSMTKHGLKVGDYINIYKNGDLVLSVGEVTSLEDDYIFYIDKNSFSLNSSWIILDNIATPLVDFSTSYVIESEGKYYQDQNSNWQSYSFKKVVNNETVDYYVRILQKLPNWKYANQEVNEETIYGGTDLLESTLVQTQKYGFDDHVGKMSFAKNIYTDDIAQVVFDDDIIFDHLRDNRGRPLSSIYFTVLKNNKGYKEWYQQKDTTNESIEYSHCFGKLTCGFYLNPSIYADNYIKNDEGEAEIIPICDTKTLCNNSKFPQYKGLPNLNKDQTDDEIYIEDDTLLYGDLCCYSRPLATEEIIQNVDYRFTTAQREAMANTDSDYDSIWINRRLNYSNIKKDDYDVNSYVDVSQYLLGNSIDLKYMLEGYYYNGNFEIPIRNIATNLTEQAAKVCSIRQLTKIGNDYKVFTNENNFLELGDTFLVYCTEEHKHVKYTVKEVLGYREFIFEYADTDFETEFNQDNRKLFKIVKADVSIPYYAEFLDDDSYKYVWHDITQNGFDIASTIEEYPFSNGRLYIHKNINLFLKRQGEMLYSMCNMDYSLEPQIMSPLNENNFTTEFIC